MTLDYAKLKKQFQKKQREEDRRQEMYRAKLALAKSKQRRKIKKALEEKK